MTTLRLALVQLFVNSSKRANIEKAVSFIERAKKQSADVVILPECFNSPYGIQHFSKYAEDIPSGETSLALSNAAKNFKINVIAGTIPERDNDALYNTCTVWNTDGHLIAKHRKMHLFDIDIKGKIRFAESEVLKAGNTLTMIDLNDFKIGIGICYDIRFEEMARLYRNKGCSLLVYPAAFNMTTGPLHWQLLQRSRANDNQCYVVSVSPARDTKSEYIAWGHSQVTNPWGEVIHDLDIHENMIVTEIDSSIVKEVRSQIPTFMQRRTDIYDTVYKHDDK
ncbi:omega-amidase NIT2-like [Microplitis mediator]|uniref:omega-amidase NIT2-like n=1 Tax=Microplitis mediator TaxID=375433 RepID=UPI002555C21C|nr:omega-amidase NIT2-like [Microplitis mediator]XP_057331677.1 omega-amidase NIT2-like [Microplitis mediator]XP_057331685.1 omega-amidase NIT2-like [Microplitis mediator]